MSTLKPKTNILLLGEFKKGNKKAFRKLFELYWESMFIRAKSILLDEDVAKDVVQEIWLNLWQKREHGNFENFEAYIFKSVSNGCFKYLRDHKLKTVHVRAIAALELPQASDITNKHNLDQTRYIIEKSLTELPPRCQQIFRLSRIEAASNEEIAERLGISKRSVENQMSIALKSIRQNLRLAQSSIITVLVLLSLL
ncbi:RNA polymerase sigma-70 factor [Flagellimonas flava]|uniref:RNA polymerase sigma-70 factor, ECF subfamily n=1 Tax=Flagellimonas flava TaxID=570519 RepID=A0A1M5IDA6_9FLAO|nr:RNA polymerase sigma-70 factor [Allomuricauda flava]SHG26241.1 RNA polymerase sigma-70 factor, ECF subfamily [Allomuricauda flava]